jgi:hypothetical protein
MGFSLAAIGRSFLGWLRFLFSAKGIPTWKGVLYSPGAAGLPADQGTGTLAYVIAYVLAFINPFTDMNAAPPQISGAPESLSHTSRC